MRPGIDGPPVYLCIEAASVFELVERV